MRRVLSIGSVLAFLAVGFYLSPAATAAVITFDLTETFDGTPPSGPLPFLSATLDDEGTPGSVILTIGSTNNLQAGEFMTQFFLNSAVDPTTLIFTPLSGPSGPIDSPGVGSDTFQLANGGRFDIRFFFDVDEFGPGTTSVWMIEGTGITAETFNLLGAPGGPKGVHLAAAEIGGIGTDGRGKGFIGAPGAPPPPNGEIPIPEPASSLLVGSGLVGLALARRRARQS